MLTSKLTSLLKYQTLTLYQIKQIHLQILVDPSRHHLQILLHRPLLRLQSSSTVATYLHLLLSLHPCPISFTTAIRFFSSHGYFTDALRFYAQMQKHGMSPTTFAVSSCLKACARVASKPCGTSIHCQTEKLGFSPVVYVKTAIVGLYSKLGDLYSARKVFDEIPEKNVVSWNSLLSGYLNTTNLVTARKLFDEMPVRDVVSWNSIVSAYAIAGKMEVALSLFKEMPLRNTASWNSILGGYVSLGKMDCARDLFDRMPERNTVSFITIISGYSRCGSVCSAREVFDQAGDKDISICNSMIACYSQNSRPEEAILLFRNTVGSGRGGIRPDMMTLSSVVSACAQLGDMRTGTWVLERYTGRNGEVPMDDHLATAVIDLYSKCGCVEMAVEVFLGIRRKDLVSYTAMILGFGINGRTAEAMGMFEEMMEAGVCPNMVTFTGLLTACCNAGLVKEGYHCLDWMRKHGSTPTADHYGIMVDLLGKVGRLEEAYDLVKTMPVPPHSGVWGALLCGCRSHGNVEMAEVAARHCFELDNDVSGYHSLLSAIYASAGRWEDADRLRVIVREKCFPVTPGCSWTDVS